MNFAWLLTQRSRWRGNAGPDDFNPLQDCGGRQGLK
jgi:hypothetical protein